VSVYDLDQGKQSLSGKGRWQPPWRRFALFAAGLHPSILHQDDCASLQPFMTLSRPEKRRKVARNGGDRGLYKEMDRVDPCISLTPDTTCFSKRFYRLEGGQDQWRTLDDSTKPQAGRQMPRPTRTGLTSSLHLSRGNNLSPRHHDWRHHLRSHCDDNIDGH